MACVAGLIQAAWQAGASDAQYMMHSPSIVGGSQHHGPGLPSQVVGANPAMSMGFCPRTPPRHMRHGPYSRRSAGKGYEKGHEKGHEKGQEKSKDSKGSYPDRRPPAPPMAPPPDHLKAAAAGPDRGTQAGPAPEEQEPVGFPEVPPPNSSEREHFLYVLCEYIRDNLTVKETEQLFYGCFPQREAL